MASNETALGWLIAAVALQMATVVGFPYAVAYMWSVLPLEWYTIPTTLVATILWLRALWKLLS